MKVKDYIKGLENFLITQEGKILGIKNGSNGLNFGKGTKEAEKENILNSDIKKIDIIKGVYADYEGIRI